MRYKDIVKTACGTKYESCGHGIIHFLEMLHDTTASDKLLGWGISKKQKLLRLSIGDERNATIPNLSEAKNGDVVVMQGMMDNIDHVGMLFWHDNQWWMLHATVNSYAIFEPLSRAANHYAAIKTIKRYSKDYVENFNPDDGEEVAWVFVAIAVGGLLVGALINYINDQLDFGSPQSTLGARSEERRRLNAPDNTFRQNSKMPFFFGEIRAVPDAANLHEWIQYEEDGNQIYNTAYNFGLGDLEIHGDFRFGKTNVEQYGGVYLANLAGSLVKNPTLNVPTLNTITMQPYYQAYLETHSGSGNDVMLIIRRNPADPSTYTTTIPSTATTATIDVPENAILKVDGTVVAPPTNRTVSVREEIRYRSHVLNVGGQLVPENKILNLNQYLFDITYVNTQHTVSAGSWQHEITVGDDDIEITVEHYHLTNTATLGITTDSDTKEDPNFKGIASYNPQVFVESGFPIINDNPFKANPAEDDYGEWIEQVLPVKGATLMEINWEGTLYLISDSNEADRSVLLQVEFKPANKDWIGNTTNIGDLIIDGTIQNGITVAAGSDQIEFTNDESARFNRTLLIDIETLAKDGDVTIRARKITGSLSHDEADDTFNLTGANDIAIKDFNIYESNTAYEEGQSKVGARVITREVNDTKLSRFNAITRMKWQTLNDDDEWTETKEFDPNPVAALRGWIIGASDSSGNRLYGIRKPESIIDNESFIAAYKTADEYGYEFNFPLKHRLTNEEILSMLAAAARCIISYASGKLSLEQIMPFQDSTTTIDDSVILKGSVKYDNQLRKEYQGIKLVYLDKDDDYNEKFIYEPAPSFVGKPVNDYREVQAAGITNEAHARELALIEAAKLDYATVNYSFETSFYKNFYLYAGNVVQLQTKYLGSGRSERIRITSIDYAGKNEGYPMRIQATREDHDVYFHLLDSGEDILEDEDGNAITTGGGFITIDNYRDLNAILEEENDDAIFLEDNSFLIID